MYVCMYVCMCVYVCMHAGIEFKDFILGFRQSTFLCTTLKCIEKFRIPFIKSGIPASNLGSSEARNPAKFAAWYVCMYVCMYIVCMYVCIRMYTYVCMYVCMYVSEHIYSLSELYIYSSLPFVFILFVSGLTFISERHSNSRFLFTTLLTAPTDMPNLAAADRWLEFSAAFRTSKFSDRVKFLLLWRDMVGVSPAESIHELNTTFSVKVIYES